MRPRVKAWMLVLLPALVLVAALPCQAEVSETFLAKNADRLDRLFTHLDPHHPDVGPLHTQWESGDRLTAANALAIWYAEKEFPIEVLEPIAFPDNLEEQATAALEDRFFILEEWETVPRLTAGGLDWEDRGGRDDKERAWMLNRHSWLTILAEVYRRTGDSRYKDQLNSLWQDWILNNPYPDRLTFSAQWRALEVARRMLNSWVHVFYGSEVLTDETRLLVLASVIDHGDALREHASFWGGNHLISEKLALLTLASAWPEFGKAAGWQTYAIERVKNQLLEQTYPDGSYKELSNHYQRVVLFNAQYFIRLIKRLNPDYQDHPVIERIEAMWDFFARVTQPDGSGPINNASDREDNAVFIKEVHEFYDRPDWLYIGTNGREGVPPDGSASHLFPWAGQAILRNGWNDKSDWVYFDAGPYGTAHQHVDRLHVSASLRGRPTLVDNGRYTYQPGPWRDYFKGPRGHNVLMLDGKAAEQGPREVQSPMPVTFFDRPEVTMAAATAFFRPSSFLDLPGFEKQIPWTRAVLLDRRGFVLIVDHLLTFDRHSIRANWHFHPGIEPDDAARSLSLVNSTNRIEASLLKGIGPPEVDGFYSPDYNEKFPSPVIRFTGQLDRPSFFVWLLQSPEGPLIAAEVLSQPGAPVLLLQLVQEGLPIAQVGLRLHPEAELLEYSIPAH